MLKKKKIHGNTFLTKHRKFSADKKRVERSMFVWGPLTEVGYIWSLSYAGIINGFLGKVGLVLWFEVDKNTSEIVKTRISRKWWK